MTSLPHTVLAIESAISGGSLSLLIDGRETGSWAGSANISKAEEMLVNIDAVLSSNGLTPADLDLVAVSAGPGSFTGIRIGIATALGLKAGLGIRMSSTSALAALGAKHSDIPGELIVAVPVGRNAVCIQGFGGGVPLDEPRAISEDDLAELIGGNERVTFLLHSALFEGVEGGPGIVDAGSNVAHAVGLLCRQEPDLVTEPLFVAKGF
jgi:tRNA threonylcarbamoyladenosine biosynthesis protein TsaB